jgi:uncharacterized damage-inducible protein DinB
VSLAQPLSAVAYRNLLRSARGTHRRSRFLAVCVEQPEGIATISSVGGANGVSAVTVESEFLNFSADKLIQLMGRIETCVTMLTPEQLWMRMTANSNAVGNLLLHLNGNVRQWILHGVGGQADMRQRNAEFAAREGGSAEELLAHLRATVEEAVTLFRALPGERLLERIRPQGYEGTVLTAIYHVVEHFAGHTFQIMLLTKQFTGEDLGFYAHLNGAQPRKDPLP